MENNGDMKNLPFSLTIFTLFKIICQGGEFDF